MIGKIGIVAVLLSVVLSSTAFAASKTVLIAGTVNNIDPFAKNKNTPDAGVTDCKSLQTVIPRSFTFYEKK